MAIDSPMKRFSMLNVASGASFPLLFEPDAGGIEADDRAFLLGLYGGNAFDVPVADPGGPSFPLPPDTANRGLRVRAAQRGLVALVAMRGLVAIRAQRGLRLGAETAALGSGGGVQLTELMDRSGNAMTDRGTATLNSRV